MGELAQYPDFGRIVQAKLDAWAKPTETAVATLKTTPILGYMTRGMS